MEHASSARNQSKHTYDNFEDPALFCQEGRSNELIERFEDYTKHASTLSTMNIRGAIHAMAERAAAPALPSSDPINDGSLYASQRTMRKLMTCVPTLLAILL